LRRPFSRREISSKDNGSGRLNRYLILLVHDSSLARVNAILQQADTNQNYRQKNFNAVRGFQIPKPISIGRGLLALGWLLLGPLGWSLIAFYAHKYASGLLVILAFSGDVPRGYSFFFCFEFS
jgi:hypothetical protein